MLRRKLIEALRREMERLAQSGAMELTQQGHKATGRGIASINVQIPFDTRGLVGQIFANDYLVPVDTGVPRARIPYNPGSGARTSQYIQGLIRWAGVVKPGLSDNEKKSFAFAVAATHKREGMPSRGAFSFSNNGRRKDWIQYGLVDPAENLEDRLRLFALLSESYGEAIRKAKAA